MNRDELDLIRPLLTSGPLLGAELDLQYRVLALTVEPAAGRELWAEGDDAEDQRVQILLHPIAEVAASFRERDEGGVRVLTFTPEQLVEMVAVMDDARLDGDPFPGNRPSREGWGPRASMQGSSGATDGRTHHVHLDVDSPPYRFVLHATFDDVEVRGPDGEQLFATDAAPHVPGGSSGPLGGRNLPMMP